MHRAEDAWRASLAEVTVADMVGEALRNAHPEALERGATWIQTIVTKRGSA